MSFTPRRRTPSSSRRPGRAAAVPVALAVAGLVLTGCAPEPGELPVDPSPAPATSAPVPPSPTPTPPPAPADPFAAPILFPGCADLISSDQVRELSGQDSFTLFDDATAAGIAQSSVDLVFGPAAVGALEHADPQLRCAWGIPNSGASLTLFFSVLPEGARTELRAALDASDFARVEAGELTEYTLLTEGGIASVRQWHGFVGDLWVAEAATAGSAEFATVAIESIRAANTE